LPKEGEAFGQLHQAFDSREVKAEFIWEAAEKIGYRTLVCTYPTTWPPRVKIGYQINGAGGNPCDYRDENTGDWGMVSYLGDDQLYATELYPEGTLVEIKEESKRYVIQLPVENRNYIKAIKNTVFTAIINKGEEGKCYIYTDIGTNNLLGVIELGKVSEAFKMEVPTEEGRVKTRVRWKLLECRPQEGKFKLYRTNFEYFANLIYPADLIKELEDLPGLAMTDGYHLAWWKEWLSGKDFLEIDELNTTWIAEAIKKIYKSRGFEMLFVHLTLLTPLITI